MLALHTSTYTMLLQLAIPNNKKALVAVYLQLLDLLGKTQVLKSRRY